ncbi:MAG: hypothetical protein QOJ84_3958 [Bradyrhizobium sp.]|jgi:ketosteroid isomerase-like protein|nr:hypothetical protein [Bradyrhizobium sp.]
MSQNKSDIIRALFAAYMSNDRKAVENSFTDDFRFTVDALWCCFAEPGSITFRKQMGPGSADAPSQVACCAAPGTRGNTPEIISGKMSGP